MRIVIMGTGPFAAPSFQSLLESQHEIAALVTRPARGRKPPPNPMREIAEAHNLPVLAPESINTDQARAALAELKPDLLIVCDYGQILARETLAVAPLGGINLHGSLLPKYRGAAPVNWAVYHGEAETGVTVIHMTPRLDAGPCLVKLATPIGAEETAEQLEPRLAQLGVQAVHDAIDMLEQWDGQSAVGELQDQSQATKAPRLTKEDGRVDWSRSAAQIARQVRAFKPWPGTYTHWNRPGSSEPLRLILDEVSALDADADNRQGGEVAISDGKQLAIAAGNGLLEIKRIQPAGKRALEIDEFLRGYPLAVGEMFGQRAPTVGG